MFVGSNLEVKVIERIKDASKQSGNIIIDARKYPEVDESMFNNIVNRMPGSTGGNRVKSVIVITSEGTFSHKF
ncbi:MAG: hypothetical protein IPP74_05245 [Alphaproteobacteria bacterium]|nr:hypothetical protein [Alphaproteobacteria bacterium]